MSRASVRIRMALGLAIALVALSAAAAVYADQTEVTSASPLGNKDTSKAQTAIGSLVADAVRDAAQTDAAFVAASELRSKDQPFPAGKIAVSDITSLLSYSDDTLAVVSLTGKALKQAMERSAAIYPQPNLGFLQVSGIKVKLDPSKAPGSRVVSLAVNGNPASETATYTVAMTNSLANGALGYWKVWTQKDVKTRLSDVQVVACVDAFLKAQGTIDYSTLDRITMAGK